MEEKISWDENTKIYMKLFTYLNKPENIKKSEKDLTEFTKKYLEMLNADPELINKPAVVERIKNILFKNMLLSSKTKIRKNGLEEIEDGFVQIFSVKKNGEICYGRNNKYLSKVLTFQKTENGKIKGDYKEFYLEVLRKEVVIIIDELGFDESAIEIPGEFVDNINVDEKFRETFKTVINHVTNFDLITYGDFGFPSITPELDSKLADKYEQYQDAIEEEMENQIATIDLEELNIVDEQIIFPGEFVINSEEDIKKIKSNYKYLSERYPNIDIWFTKRYGKKFLRENEMFPSTNINSQQIFAEKVKNSTLPELEQELQKLDITKENLIDIINVLYKNEYFGKAEIFFGRLSDEEKLEFLKSNLDYDSEFIARCGINIESDDLKKQLIESEEWEFSLFEKMYLVCSLVSEDAVVSYINENLEEIIEYDEHIIIKKSHENVEEDYVDDEDKENDIEKENELIDSNFESEEYISELIMDNLTKKENRYEFLLKLGRFSLIKGSYIEDFSKEELLEIVNELEENLDIESFDVIVETGKLEDEEIIQILEDNWEQGLNLVENDIDGFEKEINSPYIKYTLKVDCLLNLSDEETKKKFLDEHIQNFESKEVTAVLLDLESNEETLNLAKKYNLKPSNYYYLVSRCSDEIKLACLQFDEELAGEDMLLIFSSMKDAKKGFDMLLNRKEIDIVTKMNLINEYIFEDEDLQYVADKKLEFLEENKDLIKESLKTSDDIEIFNVFVCGFWDDDESFVKIEKDYGEFLK